jgi:hypothetical protein
MNKLLDIKKVIDSDILDSEVLGAIDTLLKKKIIEFDSDTGTIIINSDVAFTIKGNVQIDCEKHITLSSGKTVDPELDGVMPYAIWLNPDLDSDGNPVKKITLPKEQLEELLDDECRQ